MCTLSTESLRTHRQHETLSQTLYACAFIATAHAETQRNVCAVASSHFTDVNPHEVNSYKSLLGGLRSNF